MSLVYAIFKYLAVAAMSVSLSFVAATQYLGLKMVSAAELASLRTAQAALSKIKVHNDLSTKRLAKKMASKAGKRLSTSMVAASTFGTVLVVAASTKFIMDDYCDEKESLLTIDSLLEGKELTFNTEECIQSIQKDVGSWFQIAAEETPKLLSEKKATFTQDFNLSLNDAKRAIAEHYQSAEKAIKRNSSSFMQSIQEQISHLTDSFK